MKMKKKLILMIYNLKIIEPKKIWKIVLMRIMKKKVVTR